MSQTTRLSLLMFLILGAVGALTPLAIDMYLPAMPIIATALDTSSNAVQITLTTYTLGFAFGQLLHGPLADSYGRKPVLLSGMALFALTSALCAMTASIDTLILLRVLQGLGGAAAAVVIMALVRDLFDREDFARTMSFIMLVMTLAPLVAPLLGGYLTVFLGWRSIFWFLTGFTALVALLVLWQIPETLSPANRQPLHFGASLRNYFRVAANPMALSLIFCGAFSFGGMFAFLTAGAFVYIDIYGVSTEGFGYLFGLNIVTMIILTTVNGRLVRSVGLHSMLSIGLLLQFAAGMGLVVAWWFELGLWGLVPFMMLFVGAISMIGSNSMGLLLSHYPTIAGTASALTGTLRFGTGAAIGAVVAALPSDKSWPMVVVMALCSLLSLASYWFKGRHA